MAAKRLCDESGNDTDRPQEKRLRTSPSFGTVIREAMMRNSFQNLCAALEPVLRSVVQEEVERGLLRGARKFSRSPSLQIKAPATSTLKLIFTNKLSLPIFTGSKIEDEESSPLQLRLIDTRDGQRVQADLPSPIKVEIVVVSGGFPSGDGDDWTSEEFERNIVQERTGRRPLVTGDVFITLRDGVATIGELSLTDNSSWIRSRKFRLAARVATGSYEGTRIKEAVSEAFVVKDHRGELYKKHYPPSLDDDVWRLERIGKDGAFHTKLVANGINTVQDFLKLWVLDPANLRAILGNVMSDKMWEGTVKHANTCDLGTKHYLHRGHRCAIMLNPICQVVKTWINGRACPTHDLAGIRRSYVEHLVRDAYKHWDALQEVDGLWNEEALLQSGLMTQGTIECPTYGPHQENMRSDSQWGLLNEEYVEAAASLQTNVHVELGNWYQTAVFPIQEGYVYNNMTESSDDDLPATF